MNIIFDIDGTLMDIEHRRHFVSGSKKDWKSFVDNIKYDVPNEPIRDLLLQFNFNSDNNIFFLSGRNEAQRDITEQQIKDCGFNVLYQDEVKPYKDDIYHIYDHWREILLMRPDDDYRPDVELKSDLYDKLLEIHGDIFKPTYQSTIIFDDRQSVVDMWRSKGLTCCQVAKGDL